MGIEPITRKEMFMASAAGESVSTPTPVTREEYFLSKIGGGGGGCGTQSDLSQTDITQPDYVKGVIRQDSLPEGYPYKNNRTIIEWDGNTEGHTMLGNYFCKVYDTALDSLAGYKLTFNSAGTKLDFTLGEASPYDSGTYIYRINFAGENIDAVLVVPADNKDNFEPGIYFFRVGDGYYPCKLSSETIHPMATEFMPALTSPNGTKYKLTVSDDGTLSAVAQS